VVVVVDVEVEVEVDVVLDVVGAEVPLVPPREVEEVVPPAAPLEHPAARTQQLRAARAPQSDRDPVAVRPHRRLRMPEETTRAGFAAQFTRRKGPAHREQSSRRDRGKRLPMFAADADAGL
jgi:hypothetical protein